MNTQQVAEELVSICREGKFHEAVSTLYADNIVSMEAGAPPGQSRETKGLDAVKAKGDWWQANHEVHSSVIEAPLVAGSHFAVVFKMDLTFKPANRRMMMEGSPSTR